MPSDESRSLTATLTSTRARATLAVALIVVIVATGDATPLILVAAGVLGALALAVAVRPSLREEWRFNVLLGLGVAFYGVAFGIAQPALATRVLAALVAVVGLLTAANHLGIVPWSDHPRRL